MAILLVDDDPLQAAHIMSLLGRQFGDVLRAAGVAEALCLIEQPGFANKLRLVISARHTPGMGGPAFVAELHARMPEIAVLVLGAGDEGASDYADEQVVFLPRPVVAEQVLAATVRMLAAKKNAPDKQKAVA
jgi:DNA-binding NtrC family response regulator